ncbi:MAG: DUF1559 domain-containing protein [Lentisphaerae bacterium]|nr:MAG: DUF1559 domain-containing protein [Lentisphaerota bacterium]
MARLTVCQNQLHQIGMAFTMYGSDYQRWPAPRDISVLGTYSGSTVSGGTYSGVCIWFIGLGPYLGFSQWRYGDATSIGNIPPDNVLHCPDAREEEMILIPSYAPRIYGYGMSLFLPPEPAPGKYAIMTYPAPHLIDKPEQVRYLADCRIFELGDAGELSIPEKKWYYRFDRIRHVSGTRVNLLFADGHVESETATRAENQYRTLQNDYWRAHE